MVLLRGFKNEIIINPNKVYVETYYDYGPYPENSKNYSIIAVSGSSQTVIDSFDSKMMAEAALEEIYKKLKKEMEKVVINDSMKRFM